MKVLYIANDSNLYGSNKSMLDLIKSMKRHKLDLMVLIPKKGDIESELRKENIKYRRIRYFTWIYPKNSKNLLKILIKYIGNLFSIIPICIFIKKEKFDIIHSNNLSIGIGAKCARIAKIKHVWHIREFMQEDHNLEFINKRETLRELNQSDSVIYISEAVKNKYNKIISTKRQYMIYNGIQIKKEKEIPNFEKENIKILITGRINGRKGHNDAIKSMQILINEGYDNIHLLIAGTGEHEEELKKYVTQNNLQKNVEFLGYINDMDKIRNYSNISIVCSKCEAFGRVTVEAMVAKNLLIGANTGGTIELIEENKTGLLYQEGNPNDLSIKIKYAIQNWNKSEEMINLAYKRAIENFNIDKCADSVYEVYKTLEKE